MTTEEILEVVTAYRDGKTIECRDSGFESPWIFARTPSWSFWDTEYRIKPELKYIPFDINDELVGKIVLYKGGDIIRQMIIKQIEESVTVGNNPFFTSYATLLNMYIFQDGSPCGKLV